MHGIDPLFFIPDSKKDRKKRILKNPITAVQKTVQLALCLQPPCKCLVCMGVYSWSSPKSVPNLEFSNSI